MLLCDHFAALPERARRWLRVLPAVAMLLLSSFAVAACGEDEGAGESGGGGETAAANESGPYTSILLNPFIGNDWRPQMQRYAEVAAEKPPLSESIESLRIVTTQDNDPNLQSPALQSAILEDPDIITMIASSETALNGLITQACDAGITVVTFDTFASAECAWKLGPNWADVGRAWADWVIRESGETSGTILVDRGEPGTSASDGMNEGIDEVLKENPDIKAVEYTSKFSPGEETKLVTQLLASNNDVIGVVSQAYAAQEALERADVNVPSTGFNYPPAMSGCLDRDAACLLIGVPPWLSAEALKLAVEVRSGERTGEPEFVPFPVPLFVSNSDVEPERGSLGEVSDLAVEFTDDTPKGAFLPVSPDWVDIEFAEVSGGS